MPANDFEKNVQQKMDELKFRPAANVWEQVEARIREKKKRRKVLFWFLLPGLLIGGGILYFVFTNGDKENIAANDENNLQQKTEEVSQQREEKKNDVKYEKLKNQDLEINQKNEEKDVSQNLKEAIKERAVEKKEPLTVELKEKKVSRVKNEKPVKKQIISSEDDVVTKSNKDQLPEEKSDLAINKVSDKETDNVINQSNPTPIENQTDTAQFINAISKKSDEISNNETLKEDAELKTDSTTINERIVAEQKFKKPAKKGNWRKYISSEIGISNYNYGLFRDFRYDFYASAGQGNTPGFYDLPKITKGISYSFGAGVQRVFTDRMKLSIGLEYHFYSANTRVGSFVKKDTTIMTNVNSSLNINEFYRNNNQFRYTHRFHVIEVPLIFEYGVSKKFPLSFSVGASYGHLMGTTALTFSRYSDVYYRDEHDYVKNYINILFSAQYTWPSKGKIKITTGPSFHYMANILENNSPYGIPRLHSLGIRNYISF